MCLWHVGRNRPLCTIVRWAKGVEQMAHVDKFTRGQVNGLVTHLERLTDNHSNPDIDIERSKDNYDLCEKEGDLRSRLRECLSHVHALNRENVNILSSWLVTLPKELKNSDSEEIRKFFGASYDFLAKRYGIDNVVGAYVHMDETTPHMHFTFVPVTHDKKKNIDKVSAKEVLTRKELKVFHQDLDMYLLETIPEIYQGGILNGETIGVENVEQLKKLTQRVKELEQDITDKEKTIQSYKKQITNHEKANKQIKNISHKVNQIESNEERSLFGKIQLSKQDYDLLIGMAKRAGIEQHKRSDLEQSHRSDIIQINKSFAALEQNNERLISRNKSLNDQVSDLLQERDRLSDNRLVYRNILKENGIDLDELKNMSDLEFKSRIIVQSIEEYGVPKSNPIKKDWLKTLKQAKSQNLIIKGLTSALELLIKAVNRIISHDRER